jgi:DNA topoisomerase-2
MHVFDEDCKIRKITCPEEIIYRFYKVRKTHFNKRKKYLLEKLNKEYSLLESKVKFINYVIEEKIIVFNRKKGDIIKQIETVDSLLVKVDGTWDYLLDLKIWSLTHEKIKEYSQKMESMKNELDVLTNTTISQMWNTELNEIILV